VKYKIHETQIDHKRFRKRLLWRSTTAWPKTRAIAPAPPQYYKIVILSLFEVRIHFGTIFCRTGLL